MKRDLYLLTASFPYGVGESFLENEIRYLSDRFRKIYLLPYSKTEGKSREVPENVVIVGSDKTTNSDQPAIASIFSLYLKGFGFKDPSLKKFRYRLAYCKQILNKKDHLLEFINKEKDHNGVYYSFWFSEWATVLSLLRSEGKIPEYISRAHGFDIYEDRSEEGFIAFRKLQLSYVKKLYCASEFSMNYMHAKYPEFREKIAELRDFCMNAAAIDEGVDWDDVDWALDRAKEILRMWDQKCGIDVEKGDYE